MVNHSNGIKEKCPGKLPETDREQRQGLARFLYDVARLAFGAVITAGCLKGEEACMLISLLLAVVITLAALRLDKKHTS